MEGRVGDLQVRQRGLRLIVAACCGGRLGWSQRYDYWRISHAPGCPLPWQPEIPDDAAAQPPPQPRVVVAATCGRCGKPYLPSSRAPAKRYCSERCRSYEAGDRYRLRRLSAAPAAAAAAAPGTGWAAVAGLAGAAGAAAAGGYARVA